VNKKTFDLALIVVLLAKPAFGLLRIGSRRWTNEQTGTLATIGAAVNTAL
jgi:hypothetical protein